MRRIAFGVLLLAAAGCTAKDDGEGRILNPQPFQYPSPDTPQNAVLVYELAWERMDSVTVASIVDDAYAGTSDDQTDPFPVTLTFTKADEIRAVGAMAMDPQIDAVTVSMGSPAAWIRYSDAADPAGWARISVFSPLVQVDRDTETFLGESHFMEFRLRPTTPAPGSGKDTIWTIVGWTEVRANISP